MMLNLIEEDKLISPEIPERFYEELYSKADILYFRLTDDFQIEGCNVSALEKLNTEIESILDNSFLTLLSDSSQSPVRHALLTCLKKGYVRDVEFQFLTLELQTIHCTLNGLTYEDEQQRRFLRLYIQDITAIKHLRMTNSILFDLLDRPQTKGFTDNSFYRFVTEEVSCDGAGITLRVKHGESIISGYWKKVQAHALGAKDFRRWHPQIWKMMIQKCQNLGIGTFSEKGSFWTGYLKEILTILHEQGEKQAFESLSEFESLALISLETGESHGYLILIDSQLARWDETLITSFEMLSGLIVKTHESTIQEESVRPEEFSELPMLNVPMFGILVTEKLTIRHANSWLESNLGTPADKLIGKKLIEFLPHEFHDLVNDLNIEELKSGQFRNLGTIGFKTYNGHLKHVKCMMTRLSIKQIEYELWYWLEHEENTDLLSGLQHSKKLESLGILTGGIVHDFDNLLSTIIGFTTLLKDEIGDHDVYSKDVKQIAETAEKAVQLTSRLLAYSNGKSFIVENLDINHLISEVAGILSRTVDKNIIIRADLEKSLQTIKADAGQIQQAILQVALNGMEAMPHGGSLVFQSRNMELRGEDPRLKKGCSPGNYIQVVISDTGMGMGAQIKGQIFDPHFSTKSDSPGRGLGLILVQQVIEQYGGFISVFSEVGKGTVFKIHIPANKQTVSRQASLKSKRGNQNTILVVDDEKLIRETAKRMLVRYGYHVLQAGSSQEAVAVYKKHYQSIDLIILDLIMPGSQISRAMTVFKKLNPQIKILASLKKEERNKIAGDLNKKYTGFIQKPLQITHLLMKVQSALSLNA
jgi:signal transduction histidine kinase/CheY-like chemotaxis protein